MIMPLIARARETPNLAAPWPRGDTGKSRRTTREGYTVTSGSLSTCVYTRKCAPLAYVPHTAHTESFCGAEPRYALLAYSLIPELSHTQPRTGSLLVSPTSLFSSSSSPPLSVSPPVCHHHHAAAATFSLRAPRGVLAAPFPPLRAHPLIFPPSSSSS